MLLLTCASLQPQATPSWLPGSLHEPRSQATSSDMRNLAHQPRRFCLALGPAPLRLLLLVPVSVLLGSSSPETLQFEERGGRPNCKLCWWSAKRKTKFCSFNDRQQFYKHTCPTNTIHFTNPINHQIWTIHRCLFPLPPQLSSIQGKKPMTLAPHQSHILKICYVSCLQCPWSQLPWSDFKLALRSRRLDSVLSWKPQIQNAHTHTIAIPTSHSALDPTHNHKRKAALKLTIALCPSSLLRFGTRNWIHHLHHCCEEQSKEWTPDWQKKDR